MQEHFPSDSDEIMFSDDDDACIIEALDVQVQELTFENVKLIDENDKIF